MILWLQIVGQFVVGFKGSLEIYSMTEGEHEALPSLRVRHHSWLRITYDIIRVAQQRQLGPSIERQLHMYFADTLSMVSGILNELDVEFFDNHARLQYSLTTEA